MTKCPNCDSDLGPVVAALTQNSERDTETKLRLCFNVHCDYKIEV